MPEARSPAFLRKEFSCLGPFCNLSFMAGFEDINIAVVFFERECLSLWLPNTSQTETIISLVAENCNNVVEYKFPCYGNSKTQG